MYNTWKKGPHGKVAEVFLLHTLKAAAPMRNTTYQ